MLVNSGPGGVLAELVAGGRVNGSDHPWAVAGGGWRGGRSAGHGGRLLKRVRRGLAHLEVEGVVVDLAAPTDINWEAAYISSGYEPASLPDGGISERLERSR
ncbi:MAG TPA: hypothetical protein VFO20_06555 [Propionibacteriaceae bacterium]|nr:hypothetical protein [Propionibacteriaceae bacterium]